MIKQCLILFISNIIFWIQRIGPRAYTNNTICLEKVSINWRLNSNICYIISVYICVLDMITWTNWWKDELRDICSLLRFLIWLIICISWECSMLMQNAILLIGYWLPNVSYVDAFTLDLLKALWPSCFCIRKIHRRPSGNYYSQETFGSYTGDLRVKFSYGAGQTTT